MADSASLASSASHMHEKGRLTTATEGRVESVQKLGNPDLLVEDRGDGFCVPETVAVDFVKSRISLYEEIKQRRAKEMENKEDFPQSEITITLKSVPGLDGVSCKGVAWQTTPVHIAKLLEAQGQADAAKKLKEVYKTAIVGKVYYSSLAGGAKYVIADGSGVAEEEERDAGNTDLPASTSAIKGQLWDMLRALEGDCSIELLTFEDKEGKMVFWHSSAHVLGECLECGFGCHLTVGPPVQTGFFYDAYMGNATVNDEMRQKIETKAKQVCTQKQAGQQKGGQGFERLVVSKWEALELFKANPFKVAMINAKIPDGKFTTVYRCGPMIDLCMGPHITNTREIKGFAVLGASTAFFGGDANNDVLQRVYGVSFPSEDGLNEHMQNLKEAKENDHRVRGKEQELFFFHPFSPGSAFFEPAGARIYNTLTSFIRSEYRKRGYQEVITPNMFNVNLWKTSGHWEHYAENMFSFTDGEEKSGLGEGATMEDHTFALKPMNCPGHCLMFKHRARSYRELPLRWADFGVLHRNEISGALTGLTRVRRFQQDDAHIFCAKKDIKDEVLGALSFMKFVYETFGMSYRLERSTRPAKATGLDTEAGRKLWDYAEAELAKALDEFQGPGTWRDNPGDGAFYGPKIDIKVFDAQKRAHQSATVQLDFQLPLKFGLGFVSDSGTQETPVMIHRAMLGSLERIMGVLAEHFRGRWPFWLSPRQVAVVAMQAGTPEMNAKVAAYAKRVHEQLYAEGFFVEYDEHAANDNHNELMKRAFEKATKFVLCVGPKEAEELTVTVEGRQPHGSKAVGPVHWGTCSLVDCVAFFKALTVQRTLDENINAMPEKPKFATMAFKKKDPATIKAKKGEKKAAAAPAESNSAAAVNAEPPAAAAPAAASRPEAAAEEGSFTVNGEVFPTRMSKLVGKVFADAQAYHQFLSKGA